MTTLSTLIGSGTPAFGMGEAATAPRPSLWQRLSGRIKRPSTTTSVSDDVAPIESLKQVIDEASAYEAVIGNDELDMNIDRVADSLDDSVDHSIDVDPRMDGQAKLDFNGPSLLPPTPPRRRLLWGNSRRDTTMDEMRQGIGALASLLGGIQNHMEQQGVRQDEMSKRQQELIACLSHLPTASAAQTESLAAIRDQIAQTADSQGKLVNALDRLGGIQETTGSALQSISQRIEQMDQRDAVFTRSLEKVSLAMETVSRASETGAKVLNRVQVGLATREDAMEETLDKHQGKFNALMAVAIAVSAAAIAVTAGVGYMVLSKM